MRRSGKKVIFRTYLPYDSRKGKFVASLVSRHPNVFGTISDGHPRIWWKGHHDAEIKWLLHREKERQMLQNWTDVIYWCIAQCQRMMQVSLVNVNCLMLFYETFFNGGYGNFYPPKNCLFPPMQRGDFLRFLRKRNSIFELHFVKPTWYIQLLYHDQQLYYAPLPPMKSSTLTWY